MPPSPVCLSKVFISILFTCKATSLPAEFTRQRRPFVSGARVPNLCLVPPWVYAVPDCILCAWVDTWNCKGPGREKERQRNQLPQGNVTKWNSPVISRFLPYILRQLDSFLRLRYISFWFLKAVSCKIWAFRISFPLHRYIDLWRETRRLYKLHMSRSYFPGWGSLWYTHGINFWPKIGILMGE